MQLYVADYLGDTRHLTTEQHGAYLLLLMTMWRSDGVLSDNPAKLARIAGLTVARWNKISDDILAFFTPCEGGITQARLVAELTIADEKSEKRSQAGKAGGRAKALKDKKAAMANATLRPKHSPEPEPEKKEEAKASLSPEATKMPKARSYPEAFEAAWKAYPHHKGRSAKPKAARLFADLPPEERAGLLAAIHRFVPNVGEACGGKGAPGMHYWLADGKHLNWTADADAGTAPPAAVFDGPPEIRTWAAERLTEGYARSYIDPSVWDAGNRALLAANPFAEGRLKRDLAEICERWNFTVRQGEVCPPVPSNDLFQRGASA